MPDILLERAAATAVVGYDLLTAEPLAKVGYARKLNRIGMTGSTAVGDCEFDLFIGGKRVGTYRNTSTGLSPKLDTDLLPADFFVPANAQIEAIVTDAANTNPVVIAVSFGKPARTGFKRRSFTRRRTSYGTRRG